MFQRFIIIIIIIIIILEMSRRHKYSINIVSRRKDSSQSFSDQYKSQDSRDFNTKKRKNVLYKEKNNIKVLKKNLVYCIGLPSEIAKKQILEKYCYMGQYGKIQKIAIKKNNFNNKNQKGPSYSTYITYSNQIQASLAILALNNLIHNQRLLRASYGTTKYCGYFLKKMECPNIPDCYFLHIMDRSNQIIENDKKSSKSSFETHQIMAENIVTRNYNNIKQKYQNDKNKHVVFPSINELMIQFIQNKKDQNAQKKKKIQKISSEQKCKSQQQHQHQIQQLQQLQIKKVYSVSTESSPIKNTQNLQEYITKLILNNCQKQSNQYSY